jgi:hypothetical protein
MLPTKFRFIWSNGFRGEEFKKSANQKKSRLWQSCLLTDRDEMSNLYRGPSIDASYQVSVHLAKWFQRRKILKIGQSEIRIACGGHVFNGSGRNEQSL